MKASTLFVAAVCNLIAITSALLMTQAYAATPAEDKKTVDPMSYQQNVNNYLERIKHKILGLWCPPNSLEETVSNLSFKVSQNGTISDITLVKSCGDRFIDDLALSTLESASPLEPLPTGAPQTLTVDFSFTCRSAETTPEDCLSQKQHAAEINPHDARAHYEYGRALRFAGRPADAIEPLQKALDLGFAGCEPYIELSLSYKKLGRLEQAEEVLQRAQVRNPNFAPAVKTLADLLFEEKRYVESAAYYRKFLQMQPDGPLSEFSILRIEQCERGGISPTDE